MESKITQYEKGFLEGLIDGEGCLCIAHSIDKRDGEIFRVELSISNTNLKLLKKAQKIIKGGSIQKLIRKNKKHKDCFLLRFNSSATKNILPQLSLIVKEHKRKIAIKILKILLKRRGGFGTWNKNYKKSELKKYYKEFYE